jgi:hypothetical protein
MDPGTAEVGQHYERGYEAVSKAGHATRGARRLDGVTFVVRFAEIGGMAIANAELARPAGISRSA